MAAVTKTPPTAPSPRLIGFWLVLLAAAQVADLVTTQVDMQVGGIEGNQVAAQLIQAGGIGLLWVVKLALVVAMACSAVLVRRYWLRHPDHRAAAATSVIWRCTQLCVLVLALTAVNNVHVLHQMTVASR